MTLRQWVWSALIVAHLAVVLVAANPFSQSARELPSPYTKSLGMDTQWQFFSPDPDPGTFIEYDVIGSPAGSTPYTFPEIPVSPYWFRSTYDRRIALMRAATENVEGLKTALVPVLCRNHPGALLLRMRTISARFPTLEEVKQGHRLNDLQDPTRREVLTTRAFPCKP